MGLDTVELVIRFEDAFGIAIPDEVATELTTPRRVKFYLLSQLNVGREKSCISQQAFYRLRKEFLPLTEVRRAEFRPAAKLAQLFPVDRRKEMWTTARAQIGDSVLPDLIRPKWLVYLLTLLTVVTAIVVFIQGLGISGHGGIAFLLSLLISGAAAYSFAIITRPLKSEFGYATVGDLADYLVLHSPHTFKKEWTQEEIAETLRQIIIDQTGVSDFHEDSHFVKDMNLD